MRTGQEKGYQQEVQGHNWPSLWQYPEKYECTISSSVVRNKTSLSEKQRTLLVENCASTFGKIEEWDLVTKEDALFLSVWEIGKKSGRSRISTSGI